MTAVFIIENFDYRYGAGEEGFVFHILNFSLEGGEIVFLNGPSGCGKTTLLNLLAGVISSPVADRCRVFFNTVGYVMHDSSLLPWLTIKDNVSVEARLRSRGADFERFARLCERFMLPDGIGGKKPRELSLGMRQRVEIAKAMSFRPDLLLIDEGMAGIDYQAKQAVVEVLWETVSEGRMTVVGTGHQISDLLRLAQRIYVFENGCVDACVEVEDEVPNRLHKPVEDLLRMEVANRILRQ